MRCCQITRTFTAALALLGAALAVPARADVNSHGDFETSVSIEVPTFRGLAPSVELAYSSSAGNGMVGVGWRLNATSAIARTGPRGGLPSGQPATGDRYVLDGEELMPCVAGSASPSCVTATNTTGTSTGYYSTRRESFKRLHHAGGLTPWTVWLTDGRTGRYETLDAGQTWLLTRSKDRHGNAMEYSYQCGQGYECELTTIRYGDHGANQGAEVHFYYQARPDITRRANGKEILISARRLRSITVEVGGSLARAYALTYTTSGASKRSMLTSVQQFARDATVNKTSDPGKLTAGATPPLPPTTFSAASQTGTMGWQYGSLIGGSGLFSLAGLVQGAVPRHYQATELWKAGGHYIDFETDDWMSFPYQKLVGDFDGDGRGDLAVGYVKTECRSVGINGVLTRKTGYDLIPPNTTTTFATNSITDCTPTFWVADYDGDHKDDLIYKFRGTLFAARLGPTGFIAAPLSQAWTVKPDHCEAADVDGDSRDDLVCLHDQAGTIQVVTARSRGDGSYDTTTATPGVGFSDPIATGDANGDGFADVAIAKATGATRTIILLLSRGDGTYTTETQTTTWSALTGDQLRSGDVDGDGLSDLILTHPTGTTIGLALSTQGVVAGGRFEVRSVVAPLNPKLLGDVDGDGILDLIAANGQNAAIGDGLGGFAAPVSAFPVGCAQATIVDTDGDGRTDLLCLDDLPSSDTPITLDDYSSTQAPRDPHRWMAGDFDGDGQGDFAYVYAMNPGVGVRTVLTTGTAHVVAWTRNQSTFFPLDDSSAAHWLVADVGGPLGRADGKDDLVMVDVDGTNLRVYTLISNGDGSYLPFWDRPWKDAAGNLTPYTSSDLGNFWPIDANGDGAADLVHLSRSGNDVILDLLVSAGTGQWTNSSTPHFGASPPAIKAPTDFRPMHINGDGLVDLVNVQSGGGMTGTVIRSLISRGDGTFTAVTDAQSAAFLDVARWQLVDANGDGLTDLMHMRSSTAAYSSGLTFNTLQSRGDGTFTGYTYTTAWLSTTDWELSGVLESTNSLQSVDLDGDGLTDLLHISRFRDLGGNNRTALVRLINPGANSSTWQIDVTKVPAGVLPAGLSWAWRPHRDSTRPNSAAIGLIDQGSGARAVYAIPSDRMIRIDNGNGGTTDLEYAPLLGARDYLPAGTLPTVTTAVTRGDATYTPAISERVTYGYAGARWSDAQQRMLGFAYVGSRDPRAAAITLYSTGEACAGMQVRTMSVDALTMQVLGYTDTSLVAPGSGPYTCLIQQQSKYACDATGCRLEDDVWLTHDTWGNVIEATEYVTDGPTRKTLSPVVPNEVEYIIDMPEYRAVYQVAPTFATTLISEDRFYYDGNPATDLQVADPASTAYHVAPGPLGEVQRIAHLDEAAGVLVINKLTYDAKGLVVRTDEPDGAWTEITYDTAYGAFPVKACDPIGCSSTTWDVVLGKGVMTKDLNSQVTDFGFDGHGRLAETTHADGSQTRIRMLDLGQVTGPQAQRQRVRTEVVDDSPGDGVVWTEQFLDGWGRTYRVEHEGGSAQLTTYSDLSLRPSQTSETFTAGGVPQRFTSYFYDALGRLVQQTAPDGTSRWWRFTLGMIETMDEQGHVRALGHDGLGEVIRVTETVNGTPHHTTYGYDAAHRLIGSGDAIGLVTSYYYDTLGRLRAERDPDRGLREYTYRADGKVLTSRDAKGQRITFDYDAVGRPARRDDLDASGTSVRTVRWTYDLLGGGTQGASLGHLVQVEDTQPNASLSTRFSYDVMGRVTEDESCIDGRCMTMRRSFDIAGRLSQLTYPDASGSPGGETVGHVYDQAGRLISVGRYLTAIDYTTDGLPTRLAYGNGVETRYLYDPSRRWTDEMTVQNGSQLYHANYAHDAVGRIRWLGEEAPTNTEGLDFTYDELGRLSRVRANDGALNRDFAYDSIGRMTYNSQLGDYHYADPAHAHAVTSTDYGARRAYDVNGNVTDIRDPGGRRIRIEWTVDDRPAMFDTSNGTHRMAYDSTGRRVKNDAPGGTSLYFGDHVAIEHGRFIKYYYAGQRLLARDDGGDVAYYHQDHSHSVRFETDRKGNVVNSYQYDVTGVPVKENEAFDDNIGYAGVHGDQELGLTYMAARYYDPVSVRFLSADSVVRDAFSPQSLDRYAYVENDPVNYWDPSGHIRRDIELMKENKQMWRSLMVSFEASFDMCGVSGDFCEAGSKEITVWGADGSIKAAIPRGTSMALAGMMLDRSGLRPSDGGLSSPPLVTIEQADAENTGSPDEWAAFPTGHDDFRGVADLGGSRGATPSMDGLSLGPLLGPSTWAHMALQAGMMGFTVTGRNETRGHNAGSRHFVGEAIDVRTFDQTNEAIDDFIRVMGRHWVVVDERIRPPGQRVWSGPHIHVERFDMTAFKDAFSPLHDLGRAPPLVVRPPRPHPPAIVAPRR